MFELCSVGERVGLRRWAAWGLVAALLLLGACRSPHVYERADITRLANDWLEVSVNGNIYHPKDHVIGAMLLKMAERTKAQKKHFFVMKDSLGRSYDQYLVRYRGGVEQSRSYQGKFFKFRGQFQPIAQKEVKEFIGRKSEGLRVMDADKIIAKYDFLRKKAEGPSG